MTDSQKEIEKAQMDTAKGLMAQELFGLNDEMIEGIYGQAYRLYNTGKYDDAMELFHLLIMVNPLESKYVLGLAGCFHLKKQYKSAVDMYAMCAVLDPENPLPHYHSSDCFLQMKDKLSACISLEMTIKRAGGQEQYRIMKDRAALTLDKLKQELEKEKS